MTMFYTPSEEKFLEERRIRRIVREEMKAREAESNPPAGFIRTMDGALVSIDDAMERPR